MASKELLNPQRKPLAISIGDPAGIGPELLLKALEHCHNTVIFGPEYLKPSSLPEGCHWHNTACHKAVAVGQPNKESGLQAYEAFKAAAYSVPEGQCSALVTLPLAKEYVALSIQGFHGHTDVLNNWWGGKSLMTLLGGKLRVALVTDHEAIKDVPTLMTLERVLLKARTFQNDIKKHFNQGQMPSMHLLGLNPHAGENGVIGKEDDILKKAIDVLNEEGGHWQGPWPADAFFARHDYGDGVLAIYHDQGLIPVKMLAQGRGVNITLGLPYVRTSPDHGTAFDIAGKNTADPSSFIASLELARELV